MSRITQLRDMIAHAQTEHCHCACILTQRQGQVAGEVPPDLSLGLPLSGRLLLNGPDIL